MAEEVKVGVITHFFSKVSVGIINLTDGELKVGDNIHIKGHTSDFNQTIESMEIEHKVVESAKKGESVGIKVKEHVREHDVVYKVVA
jgi:translation elongation factor EF-Tu-like GTPase